RYPTRIESVDAAEFTLAVPADGPAPTGMRPGKGVMIQMDSEQGPIQFRTWVLACRMEDIPLIVLAWPETCERCQRREFVRVPLRIPVRLTFAEENGPGLRFEARTTDISGGGLHLVLSIAPSQSLKVGQSVSVVLYLPDDAAPVTAEGSVVRVRRTVRAPEEKSPAEVFDIGIELHQVKEQERNRICRQVYARQIELRQKGLL
ncbi:MAG TPA: PilZ domain-containing protein, partial [Armatimonadota bacterium]|nr:PilZ domain-containing protein [Armatimonadota bacterium]